MTLFYLKFRYDWHATQLANQKFTWGSRKQTRNHSSLTQAHHFVISLSLSLYENNNRLHWWISWCIGYVCSGKVVKPQSWIEWHHCIISCKYNSYRNIVQRNGFLKAVDLRYMYTYHSFDGPFKIRNKHFTWAICSQISLLGSVQISLLTTVSSKYALSTV